MNVHLIFKSFGKRIKFCAIFFLAVITFSCVEVLAQNHEWVSVFTGASSIQANAITVDASGNVYTTGVFAGTADFDPGAGEVSLTSAGNNDIFITKLNASGALVWARKVGGTGTDEGLAIRVDASSNVLVSGKFTSTVDFDPGAGTSNLTANSTDLFVLKLNSAGDYVWAKRWGSNLESEHIGLAVDGSGNVYTGGSFRNTIDLDPGAGTASVTTGLSNITHTFLVKLDASGNYVLGKRLGTPTFSSVVSRVFETDASSNIIIAGQYFLGNGGTDPVDFNPDAGTANLGATGGYFVAKYNSSLAYVSAAEAPPVTITDLHADASGNLLATGQFTGTKDFDPGVGVTNLVSSGSVDAYAFKLNAAFELLWAKNFGGTVDDQGFSIKSDASGNVYIAGEFFGTSINDFDPGAGTVTLTVGPNGYDGFILKLNASGEYVWVQSFYGPFSNGYEKVSGLFVDGSNNVYATGFFTNGTVDFNPGAGADNKTAASSDAFALKWNQNVLTSQTITFNALPAKAMGDAPFALTATASSGLPVSYTSSNTGVATVSGNTVTLIAPGTTTITASQAGNGTFAPASNVPQSLTVTKGNQTITFGTLPLKTFGDSNFILSATASSGLSVSYASSNTGVATISGNTVTIVGAGTTNITASQAGNTNYNAAANAVQPLYVDKADQTITFSPFPNKEAGDPDFALSASATSGLPITFTSSSPAVATISGNVVSVGNVGQSEITAWQYGNANYNEATPVSYILTVTSSDVTAPTISSFNPINNATDVAVASNLVATFSEPIELVNSKIIQIVRYPELVAHEQYTLPSANVQVSGSTLTINPANNFLNSAAYYVFIASDAITDVVGNPFAGIVSNGMWQFNTVAGADITAPTISSLSPADNATGVAVNGDLVVTFSENIVANTGVITIRDIGGSIHSSYSVNGGATIANNTLTITPSFNLNASTEYYVDLGVGVVKDAAGNTFAGLNGNPNWTFTTQALEVSALSYAPANGNTNVAVSSDLSITFEENITIATGTISVHHASNGMLITSLTNYNGSEMTINGATVTFNMPNDLPANTEVYVNVTSGYLRSAANSQKIWPGIEDNTSWRFTTGKLNQTITFGALPEKAFGEAPFALSATASSGLTVAYASSNPAVATVSGNTVTILGVGTTTITASQAGNASYNAAANVPQTLTVNKVGQTITFGALPAKTIGDANFTLSATASSGLTVAYTSSNTAVATVSGNTVTIVGAGSTTITASQTGNANYNAATNMPQTLTVNKASQTITFGALPAKTFGDANFTLGATSSSGLSVSYASSNTAVATVSGNTVTIVGAGSTTITASQTGNANYNAATNVPQTLTVNKASQTITFAALPAKTFGDANFTLGATSSSGLSVSYASSNTSVATVSGNTVTIVGAGSTTITASQTGNANYNAATNVPQTLTVNKAGQIITFAALPAKTFGEANFTLGATSSSGLTVSYASSNTAVATVSGNTVTIVGAGSTTITASQAGNANYNAATNVPQTLTVNKAGQTITFAALPAKTFGDANFTLGATSSSGLTVAYASSNTAVATVSGNTVTIVGAGSTTITASQAGNANYNAATNVPQTLTVNKASQTITFAALPAKTFGDANFTLGATASSGLTVSYASSNTAVATVRGNTVTIIGAGSTTITASQAGNVNYNAATNVPQTLTVDKASQTITVSPIADKLVSAAPFAVSASTTSGLSLTYAIASGPATISGNTITLTGASGTVEVAVSQAGNTNYNSASSSASFFVSDPDKANQTITFAELPAKAFGATSFSPGATASSGLPVSYTSSNLSVATINGSLITITGVGSTTITASQAGNAAFNPAPSVRQTLTVSKGSQTITFDAIADKSFGDAAFTLSPTASSSLVVSLEVVSGPVTLNGSEATITGAGTATIKATQAGNENFNAASPVERTFTIAKKVQVITIADIEDKLTTDAAFDLVVSVDSDLALSYSIDGPATLSGATVTLTGEEGTVTITVSQGGNENYLAAEAATTFEVTAPEVDEKQEQTITFAAIADKTFGDQAFALEATATSELAVSFEVVSGPATLSGNTVTITGAGTATIRASQSGDETFQAAVAVERSFAIAKKAQTIVVESIGDKLTTDGPIAVNATTDSGLELSYSVTGPASLTGTTLTLTGVEGTVTVTANQVGNDNYLAAEATEAFEVTAPVVKALSVTGVASLGNSAFTQGEAKLHPKNSNGTFGTPIISALSANGAFTFDDVPAGQYALSVASASTAVLTTYFEKATTLANATLITLSTESIEGIVVDMIEKPSVPGGPGSIAGKLLLSDDGSRHLVTDGRTMEGTPLSGVTILLVSSPGGELIASTVTTSDGSFGFSNLPLGAYKLLIDYEGNVSLESPEITISTGQLSFEVASEVTDEGIVIIAMPTATTGVSAEVLRSMIKTYPNPSQGQFTIAWDGSLADVKEIIIHNNNGSAVWQHSMTTAQLTVDISSQPAGVYILRLVTSHGAAVHKLVIK